MVLIVDDDNEEVNIDFAFPLIVDDWIDDEESLATAPTLIGNEFNNVADFLEVVIILVVM